MELPKAEDVLNAKHKEIIKRDGVESIHTPDFPLVYKEQAIAAMHEYGRRLLDVAADIAGKWGYIDKEDVLKLKEMLK